MKINRLLVLSAASVLIGGGGFALTSKALANPFNLVAQDSSQPTEQREGWGGRPGFAGLTGLTDAQKTQLRQIRSASHQQIDAIPTSEQKAQMQAIHQNAKTKMDAVLTEQQRQQLQQNSSQPNGQRKGPGFAKISGLTDNQKAQLKQIHEATRQQMDAMLTSEQKAQMQAIRQDAKTKMDAVLSDQQRQQLQQLHQQWRQQRPQ